YLAEKSVLARSDSSNTDPTYKRNYIRHQIIASVEQEFPGWRKSLSRLRELITCQEELLTDLSRKAYDQVVGEHRDGKQVFDLAKFRELHLALKRRLIANALRGFDLDPDFETVSRVLALVDYQSSDSALTLSESLEVRKEPSKECRYLVWSQLDKDFDADIEQDRLRYLSAQSTEVRLPAGNQKSVSNIIAWLDCSLRVEKINDPTTVEPGSGFPSSGALEALVDLSNVEFPLCIRSRRSDDFIQPFGMPSKVRLKQFLHTHKVKSGSSFALQADLSTAIVLACGDEILWVPQIGISELLRVKKWPTHRLSFQKLSHEGPVIA
ncbi:MAG: hypothetical protein K8F91_23130, partial [Candidatus Obscuribacterales bacterium]|nr:hypothetical protein [Candidatus Obscuribacterales bacterium]